MDLEHELEDAADLAIDDQGGSEAVTETDQGFRNQYLSVSRIKLFEKCPQAFRYRYVHKRKGDPSTNIAASLGKLVHKAFEIIFTKAEAEEYVGPVTDEMILSAYRTAFGSEPVFDQQSYVNGGEWLRGYFRRHPKIDAYDILGTEVRFDFDFEGFHIMGYIDRIDRVDDETIRVVDYKTNRFAFSREALATDLQVSVYEFAVRMLFEQAKNVQLRFDMVRLGFEQATKREAETSVEALRFMVDMAKAIEHPDQPWEAKLNPLCPWCDHRSHCVEYQEAITQDFKIMVVAPEDLEAVAGERERAKTIETIASRRKSEIESILFEHIARSEDEAIDIGDTRYRAASFPRRDSYPVDSTVKAFLRARGRNDDDAIEEVKRAILSAKPGDVDAYAKTLEGEMSSARLRLLQAELGALAVKIEQAPRLLTARTPAKRTADKRDSEAAKVEKAKAKKIEKLSERVRKLVRKARDNGGKLTKLQTETVTMAVPEGVKGSEFYELTGALCSVCGSPQFATYSGDSCDNGHGGAPGDAATAAKEVARRINAGEVEGFENVVATVDDERIQCGSSEPSPVKVRKAPAALEGPDTGPTDPNEQSDDDDEPFPHGDVLAAAINAADEKIQAKREAAGSGSSDNTIKPDDHEKRSESDDGENAIARAMRIAREGRAAAKKGKGKR